MTGEAIYVVTDVELDGPLVGVHSMLAFASVAVTAAGDCAGEFEAVLAPLEDAVSDPGTMAFWRDNPEAYAEATDDPRSPDAVMQAFVAWVGTLPGDPVFAAHPAVFDGPWIDHYLRRFAGHRLYDNTGRARRLFRHLPLCVMSFAAGRLGWHPSRCSVAHYPPEWLGRHEHRHRAIDDARGYAHLLCHLMRREAGS